MTIVQRFTSSSPRMIPTTDSDVIMIGNDLGEQCLYLNVFDIPIINPPLSALHYIFDGAREAGVVEQQRVPIFETNWFIRRGRAKVPVTREDFLRVVSNIDTILVRASVAQDMSTAGLSRVNMDIAVAQATGGPRSRGAEECRCPPGYTGLSCEQCAVGYYRDREDRSGRAVLGACVRCPCNDNEQTCGRGLSGRVECTCKDGWGGAYCDSRGKFCPIYSLAWEISILGTIHFSCMGKYLNRWSCHGA